MPGSIVTSGGFFPGINERLQMSQFRVQSSECRGVARPVSHLPAAHPAHQFHERVIAPALVGHALVHLRPQPDHLLLPLDERLQIGVDKSGIPGLRFRIVDVEESRPLEFQARPVAAVTHHHRLSRRRAQVSNLCLDIIELLAGHGRKVAERLFRAARYRRHHRRRAQILQILLRPGYSR